MLAYVFWHRPLPGVEAEDYEQAQRAFHAALGIASACFRLAELPFEPEQGYEDWYLVDGWRQLGELNEAGVDAARRGSHDHAASLAAVGWGGVYSLARGPARIPEGTEWLDKPRGERSDGFIDALPGETVWRRQLVLGPGPEFCVATAEAPARWRI